nr:MAG TPA: hypothetical protein [Caudoviricetes sp.]
MDILLYFACNTYRLPIAQSLSTSYSSVSYSSVEAVSPYSFALIRPSFINLNIHRL